ncbi:hypothetical protein OHB01_28250 [Microbispora hainanensis]|uniref:hypothetical protein n=1 Tax=Microbispora TaxID=2005 RepID=UPI001C9CD973|nr:MULTISPECIES: hypothetical protein [Microbispora]
MRSSTSSSSAAGAEAWPPRWPRTTAGRTHPAGETIALVSERCIPPSIIVSADGRRFTDESVPYVNFVHDQGAGGHVPAWFVMDA